MAHALVAFIREQMDSRGWGQADLARRSGLSRQLVSKLHNDDRSSLPRIPKRDTIDGLAKAFDVPPAFVLSKAVEALGIGFEAGDVVNEISTASNERLLLELRRRLDDATTGSGKVSELGARRVGVPKSKAARVDRGPGD